MKDEDHPLRYAITGTAASGRLEVGSEFGNEKVRPQARTGYAAASLG